MVEPKTTIRKKVESSGIRKARLKRKTATPGFRTNRSQENATPLNELSHRRNGPTTKLDEASTTSYTKNLEKLRQRAMKQL